MSLLESIGSDYTYELVRDMAEKLPPVWAGGPKELPAAEFIRDELAKYGIEVSLLRFKGAISHPGPGTLEIVGSDSSQAVPCNVLAQSEPTDGLTAEALHIGSGGEDDYVGVDVRGKIVVVNLNFSPPRPEKMRLAKKYGAVGMVMINWGRDDDDSLPFGTTKYLWGNPERKTADDIVTLPAVAVTRPNGLALVDELKKNPEFKLRITASPERKWRDLILPITWIGQGRESNREFVLVGGHYDSWGGGVTDNLSGDAAMVAMARYFHSIQDRLTRDVAVAWWPAHESGMMTGSTWFVDSHWRLLRERCVAYVQVDQLGMGDLELWRVEGPGELRQLVETTNAPDEFAWTGPTKTGDASFYGVGIPNTNSFHTASPQQQKAGTGEFLGWWYHSEHDTFDKLNKVTLNSGMELISGYVERIATSELLPYRMDDPAQEILNRLLEIDSALKANGWNPDDGRYPWNAVVREAHELLEAAIAFHDGIERAQADGVADNAAIARWNDAMIKFSRFTVSVRYSTVDRYHQDSYGESRLTDVLPELRVLVERAGMKLDGNVEFLMDAEIFRALNRLSDALVSARSVLNDQQLFSR